MLSILVLLFASSSFAQNNSCFGTAPTGNVSNPKELSVELVTHNILDPNGASVVTGYVMNAIQGTTVVSSVTLAKTAFSLQAGTPANCYKVTLPAFTGIQANNLYKIGLIATGVTNSNMGVSSNSFFLSAVPAEPTNLRLAILNMLSKLWDKVLSTTNSKVWFKPIGR